MKVWVMRGLPGAGKSKWVKDNIPNPVICSADDFFIVNGVYQYNGALLGKAHAQCLKKFTQTIITKRKINLVVDNTNIAPIDFTPYTRLCEAFEVPFEIVRIFCPLKIAFERQTHGVPLEVMERMDHHWGKSRFPETVIYETTE